MASAPPLRRRVAIVLGAEPVSPAEVPWLRAVAASSPSPRTGAAVVLGAFAVVLVLRSVGVDVDWSYATAVAPAAWFAVTTGQFARAVIRAEEGARERVRLDHRARVLSAALSATALLLLVSGLAEVLRR